MRWVHLLHEAFWENLPSSGDILFLIIFYYFLSLCLSVFTSNSNPLNPTKKKKKKSS